MTLLLGGTVLLIAGSAVALVLGWLNANEGFIWASIVATAVAAALLIVAFFRSRKEAPAAATAAPSAETMIDPEILADREERAQQKYERATTHGEEEGSEDAAGKTVVSETPADATVVNDSSEATDQAESDMESEGSPPPAPGTVVTSSTLGGAAGAATAGDPQTDPDATAATVGPPAGGAGATGEVVVVPKTKKFHNTGCRFASAKGAEQMDHDQAVAKGYQPCGVCKP